MAKFITGKELTEEVYDIIHKAKKQLLIVSPYIKLDDYFKKELFDKHKINSELHLLIGFGKNEKNPQRSLKKEDLDYFKDFPNVSIIYIPNLHAKYYANEKKGIITSINLYDYSFTHNVEFGVVSEATLFGGSGIDKEAWEETMKILRENYTIFIKRPVYKKKFLGKDYIGSDTQLDIIDQLLKGKLPEKRNVFDFINETYLDVEESQKRLSREEFDEKKHIAPERKTPKSEKYHSATNLGKIKGKTFIEVIKVMQSKEYILGKEKITKAGIGVGIKFNENEKGHKWIVYPESLSEIL